MKKRFLVFWMSLLCVCGLGLAACGGKSDSGVDSGGAVEEVVVDPSEKFLGSWELAAMEFQNITVVGDISSVVGLVDEEMGEASESGKLMVFEFKDDKTGVVTFAGDTATFTWELADDNTVTVTPDKKEADEEADDAEDAITQRTIDFAYEDDALTGEFEANENTYHMTLTKDGTLPGAPVIDLDSANGVTSKDQLVGTWNLAGMQFVGAAMYGKTEDLAAMYGNEDVSAALEIGDDTSSVKFMGEDCSLTESDGGICIDIVIAQLPFKMVGDYLVVDLSPLVDAEIALIYAK